MRELFFLGVRRVFWFGTICPYTPPDGLLGKGMVRV